MEKLRISKKEMLEIVGDDLLNLGYELDLINEFLEEYGCFDYVQDSIMEIADSYVEIYVNKLFKLYSNNSLLLEWHTEAQHQGLIADDTELIKQLQYGQYEYNSHLLYKIADEYNLLD